MNVFNGFDGTFYIKISGQPDAGIAPCILGSLLFVRGRIQDLGRRCPMKCN